MNASTKELAEQAGFGLSAWKKLCVRHSNGSFVEIEYELERFAELIRQDEREQISHTYLKLTLDAVLREREACAKLCEGLVGRSYEFDMGRLYSAEAIRARSKHETT